MRTAILLPLLTWSALAHAQSWCPPGAQWNYSIYGLGLSGYVVRTYETDTLFEGVNAQRIHETGVQVLDWLPPGEDTLVIDNYAYTSVVDSTLLLWVSATGTEGWDTLFRFDAQIGDRWFPPGADDICNDGLAGMAMLVDTGHTMIDGIPLRTWTLDYCTPNGDPWGYDLHFTERLGYHGGLQLWPGGCIIIEYGETLSCYTDNEISYNDLNWPFGCASITGLNERGTNERILPFPNPGTDRCSLQLPTGVHTIEVLDATGRRMVMRSAREGTLTMDTTAWPAGIYTVLVRDAANALHAVRWVKQ